MNNKQRLTASKDFTLLTQTFKICLGVMRIFTVVTEWAIIVKYETLALFSIGLLFKNGLGI